MNSERLDRIRQISDTRYASLRTESDGCGGKYNQFMARGAGHWLAESGIAVPP